MRIALPGQRTECASLPRYEPTRIWVALPLQVPKPMRTKSGKRGPVPSPAKSYKEIIGAPFRPRLRLRERRDLRCLHASTNALELPPTTPIRLVNLPRAFESSWAPAPEVAARHHANRHASLAIGEHPRSSAISSGGWCHDFQQPRWNK